MTRPELTPESVQLLTDRTEDLTTRVGDSLDKVVDTLGQRLKAFDAMHTREGLSADPERLAAIAAGLFDKVDSLIFLAEDYQSLAKRIRESQPVVAEATDDQNGYYSKEELELYDIFQMSDDSAVPAVWILSKGFGLSTSENYTTRKKLLQKTIASLHDKLSRTEPPMEIIKTGQTRGTKYQLAELAISEVVPQLVVAKEQPVAVEPQPTTTVTAPEAPVARQATNEQSVVTQEHESAIASAIQRLIDADTERPIICLGDISIEAFGSGRIDERIYLMVKHLVSQDPRITEVGKNEYRINGREDNGEWIDSENIEARVHAFIDDLTQRGIREAPYNALIRTVGRQRRFLTSPERIEMMRIVREHPQFVGFDGRNVTINLSATSNTSRISTGKETSSRATRGLTKSELNSRLTELGFTGSSQPFHRHNGRKRSRR